MKGKNNMTHVNKTNRVLASAAAIAIAASGLGGFTTANAQVGDTTVTSAAEGKGPLASTLPDGNSTLTLHKKINPKTYGEADPKGAEQDGVAGEAAGEGYTFTLKKVAGVDQLRDQDTFNALAGLSQVQDRNIAGRINDNTTLQGKGISAPTGDADFTLNTDENGVATQADIPNGVYLVEETKSPDNSTSQVHPFLVFLPQPDPAADTKATAAAEDWNNDVHVYPKNGRTSIDKKVVDANKNVGDRVNYTLKATVPSSAEGETLTKFNLRDIFNDKELGNFQFESATVQKDGEPTDLAGVTQGEPTAVPNGDTGRGTNTYIDYVVPVDGLEPGDIVTVNLSAELLDTREDSEIINEARTVTRHSGDDSDKYTKQVDVRTYVGDIEITKFSDINSDGTRQADSEEALAGAEFELYRTESEARERAANLSGTTPDNAVGTATTGDDGKATFTGLHVNDFENNAEIETTNYWLVETKAPDGFVLPEENENVRALQLTRNNNTAADGQPVVLVSNQNDIPNVPNDRVIPELPGTGENGVLILGGLAFLLLGGAAVYMAVNSSRNRNRA